jgi:hypothetical protein
MASSRTASRALKAKSATRLLTEARSTRTECWRHCVSLLVSFVPRSARHCPGFGNNPHSLRQNFVSAAGTAPLAGRGGIAYGPHATPRGWTPRRQLPPFGPPGAQPRFQDERVGYSVRPGAFTEKSFGAVMRRVEPKARARAESSVRCMCREAACGANGEVRSETEERKLDGTDLGDLAFRLAIGWSGRNFRTGAGRDGVGGN